MGLFFPKFPQFWVFAMKTPENCEKWAYILRKIPEIGTFSCQMTIKNG